MNYLQITSGNIRQIQFKPHTIRNEVPMKLIYIHSIKCLLFVAKYVEPTVIFIIVYICGAFICAEVQAAAMLLNSKKNCEDVSFNFHAEVNELGT